MRCYYNDKDASVMYKQINEIIDNAIIDNKEILFIELTKVELKELWLIDPDNYVGRYDGGFYRGVQVSAFRDKIA